jgi:hypothetical protein
MRRRFSLLLALASLCSASELETIGSPRMEFTLENGAHANLVYHALCFAEQISCTREAYQKLWKENLSWSPADERMMSAFKRAVDIKGPPPLGRYPFPANYPTFYSDELRQRTLFAALLDARNLDDATQRAEKLVGRRRSSAIRAMFDTMKPRFDQWWAHEGEVRSLGYARAITTVLREHKLVELSETVARLMGFEWQGKQRIRFHVIAHAEADPHAAHATQIQQQAVLEATKVLSTEKYVSISLHELFHYFFDSLPLERHLALMREFAASDEKFAGAYYTLLNEALVSSLAAVVDQRLMPASFRKESTNLNYSHPYIAPLARAMFTLTPARLEQSRNLLDGIADPYISQGKVELGPDAGKLAFGLMSRGVFGTSELRDHMAKPLRESSPAIGVFTNAKLLRHFEYANILRLAIKPGSPRADVRDLTPKSVEVRFTAPDEPSLDKLIRDFFAR